MLECYLSRGNVARSYDGAIDYAMLLDWFWTFSQAEACKSFSYALKKCPSGMYAEIKYDGERVQVLWENIIQIDVNIHVMLW